MLYLQTANCDFCRRKEMESISVSSQSSHRHLKELAGRPHSDQRDKSWEAQELLKWKVGSEQTE